MRSTRRKRAGKRDSPGGTRGADGAIPSLAAGEPSKAGGARGSKPTAALPAPAPSRQRMVQCPECDGFTQHRAPWDSDVWVWCRRCNATGLVVQASRPSRQTVHSISRNSPVAVVARNRVQRRGLCCGEDLPPGELERIEAEVNAEDSISRRLRRGLSTRNRVQCVLLAGKLVCGWSRACLGCKHAPRHRIQCPECLGTGRNESVYIANFMGLGGNLLSVSECETCNGSGVVNAKDESR